MKHGFFGAAVGVVGFALGFTPSLSAQQLVTLRVTVRDPSGRVLSQARIALDNVDTDAKRTDLTSGTGVAVIPGLPAGSYQLTVESDQFRSYQAPLTLTVGHIASASLTLGVATVKQEVDVEDTVLGVEAQNSEVSQVVDAQKISDPPMSLPNTLQSPRYYTIFAGFDVNGEGFPFPDRVGDIGRNTYRGDSSYATDMGLQRVLNLGEGDKAAAFTGPISQRFGDGVTSGANPTFGTPNFVAPSRQIQIAMRLNF